MTNHNPLLPDNRTPQELAQAILDFPLDENIPDPSLPKDEWLPSTLRQMQFLPDCIALPFQEALLRLEAGASVDATLRNEIAHGLQALEDIRSDHHESHRYINWDLQLLTEYPDEPEKKKMKPAVYEDGALVFQDTLDYENSVRSFSPEQKREETASWLRQIEHYAVVAGNARPGGQLESLIRKLAKSLNIRLLPGGNDRSR